MGRLVVPPEATIRASGPKSWGKGGRSLVVRGASHLYSGWVTNVGGVFFFLPLLPLLRVGHEGGGGGP